MERVFQMELAPLLADKRSVVKAIRSLVCLVNGQKADDILLAIIKFRVRTARNNPELCVFSVQKGHRFNAV